MIINDRALKWSADYLTQTEATIFDEAWGNLLIKNSNLTNNGLTSLTGNSDQSELDNITNTANNNQLNDEMRKTANELLDTMQDSRFSETEVNLNTS